MRPFYSWLGHNSQSRCVGASDFHIGDLSSNFRIFDVSIHWKFRWWIKARTHAHAKIHISELRAWSHKSHGLWPLALTKYLIWKSMIAARAWVLAIWSSMINILDHGHLGLIECHKSSACLVTHFQMLPVLLLTLICQPTFQHQSKYMMVLAKTASTCMEEYQVHIR